MNAHYGKIIVLVITSITTVAVALAHSETYEKAFDDFRILYNQGRLNEAAKQGDTVVRLAKTKLGNNNQEYVMLIYFVIGVYGDIDHAAPEWMYKELLNASENTFGPEDPRVGTALQWYGKYHKSGGRPAEALPYYQRCFDLFEAVLGPNSRDTGVSADNLAEIYRRLHRFTEAENYYRRSLKILETALGKEHPEVATVLYNYAASFVDQGRYLEAEPLLKRSLDIRRAQLPATDFNRANAAELLGLVFAMTGRAEEAIPYYEESLQISREIVGPKHPRTQALKQSLHTLYMEAGQTDKAKSLIQP